MLSRAGEGWATAERGEDAGEGAMRAATEGWEVMGGDRTGDAEAGAPPSTGCTGLRWDEVLEEALRDLCLGDGDGDGDGDAERDPRTGEESDVVDALSSCAWRSGERERCECISTSSRVVGWG